MQLDLLHVIGYVGALGSLVFGANQLRVILQRQSAKDVSAWDYALRVGYSVVLGAYSVGIGDPIFVIVNFGAAILSLAVAVAAWRMKQKKGG
jgi:hypothetical protein